MLYEVITSVNRLLAELNFRLTEEPLLSYIERDKTLFYQALHLLEDVNPTDDRARQIAPWAMPRSFITASKRMTQDVQDREQALVITSYSIHYTKLYEPVPGRSDAGCTRRRSPFLRLSRQTKVIRPCAQTSRRPSIRPVAPCRCG